MLELHGRTIIETDRDALYDRLAGAMAAAAQEAIAARGVFHLALPGGTTPEPFFLHLVIDPRYRLFPWEQTQVWLVDERCVPPDDERSNAKLLRESLLDQVPLADGGFHAIDASTGNAAEQYEALLSDTVLPESSDEGPPAIDFVLLGVGDDGHVASLFPGHPATLATDRLVARAEVEDADPPHRITLKLPAINAARQVAMLITGRAKAGIVQRISRQSPLGPAPKSLPATAVRPPKRRLSWYLDADAAGR